VRRFSLLAACSLAACNDAAPPVPPLPGAEASVEFSAVGDWPGVNRDLAGTRFSPLRQIDTINVNDLRVAWTYPLGDNAASFELTPLVVAGVLYATTADRVVALRADNGMEIWSFALDPGAPARRGVAYWPGDAVTEARVYVTLGRRLIALDAASGRKAQGFGAGGETDMPAAYNAAPTRFEDLLVVGSHGAPGGVRAFSARSGAPVWEFVPEPEAPLALAFSFTIDVDRGVLYAPLASAGADEYYGGNRASDEVFGRAVVALDARTGVLRWHFQTVHHDIWNYDLLAPPALVDASTDAGVQPLLVQPAKTGYLYVLNRVTGAPVFGVAETPMPGSDVPGERSAPTQPIPVKPEPVARVSFAAEDLVAAADTNPAHAANCRALRDGSGGLRNVGPFTPYRYRAPDAEPRASLVFPGVSGGAGSGGVAADPTLGLVFVNTTSEGSIGWIERNSADATAAQTGEGARRDMLPYRRMSAAGDLLARFAAASERPTDDGTAAGQFWPCQKPPWGELVAVAAATGEIAWRTSLGVTPELPEDRQRTGRPNRGGAIATAGGLVFVAAADDRRLRAFATQDGAELWATELPRSGHAVPITYLGGDGKQYVAIVAGGADDTTAMPSGAQAIIAYALP
jgi:quinoprotein glucose dehydrogenase